MLLLFSNYSICNLFILYSLTSKSQLCRDGGVEGLRRLGNEYHKSHSDNIWSGIPIIENPTTRICNSIIIHIIISFFSLHIYFSFSLQIYFCFKHHYISFFWLHKPCTGWRSKWMQRNWGSWSTTEMTRWIFFVDIFCRQAVFLE